MRQQHSPDGVVELEIDAILHCPTGCAPHPVSVSAELHVGGSLGLSTVMCARTADVGPACQVILTLQVRPHILDGKLSARMFSSQLERGLVRDSFCTLSLHTLMTMCRREMTL